LAQQGIDTSSVDEILGVDGPAVVLASEEESEGEEIVIGEDEDEVEVDEEIVVGEDEDEEMEGDE
jgi:hypothetical protein